MSGDWYTAHEIQVGTGLPMGTIWRLAHQFGWRRRDRFKPARYSREDVDRTMEERDARGLSG